jgi:hypothetical protein
VKHFFLWLDQSVHEGDQMWINIKWHSIQLHCDPHLERSYSFVCSVCHLIIALMWKADTAKIHICVQQWWEGFLNYIHSKVSSLRVSKHSLNHVIVLWK